MRSDSPSINWYEPADLIELDTDEPVLLGHELMGPLDTDGEPADDTDDE